MPNVPSSTDPRVTSQIEADEAAAYSNWEGFETENLLDEEGALQILNRCRILTMQEGEMNQLMALGSVREQPFRWKDKVYRIINCSYVNNQAIVEVVPNDPEFAKEVKRRIESDRFHNLNYYQGFGFVCFPEDYQKYQDQ
jgi:hypothetical protein